MDSLRRPEDTVARPSCY